MKVLITGAGGMVARAAVRHCRAAGDRVVPLARQDLDITDQKKVFELISAERPAAVLNCAAYTDVDGAEENRDRCYQVNATGVENLALAARRADARFVTISTDYVFDGAKTGFYTQRDTPEPLASIYSQSKLEGEYLARRAYARSIIVRSGWIYGAGGTNFLSRMHQYLAAGRPIRAIADSYGTPTSAADLARRLRELTELDLPGVYHVVNRGPGTSYLGFAEKVCEIGGFDPGLVAGVSSAELRRPAPRPQSSKLKCLFSKRLGLSPLPDWEKALGEFLDGELSSASGS